MNTVTTVKNILKEAEINDYQLTIVNDASTDKTLEVLTKKVIPKVKVINFTEGPTRRENLAQAMAQSKAETVCFTDADMSTDLRMLPQYLIISNLMNDVVIGNRYHELSNIDRTKKRLIISKSMNWVTRVLFNTGLDDHFIGLKVFPRAVIQNAIKDMDINYSRKMWWDAELLIRLRHKGVPIITLPVIWQEGSTSSLHFFKEIPMLMYMIKMFIKLRIKNQW